MVSLCLSQDYLTLKSTTPAASISNLKISLSIGNEETTLAFVPGAATCPGGIVALESSSVVTTAGTGVISVTLNDLACAANARVTISPAVFDNNSAVLFVPNEVRSGESFFASVTNMSDMYGNKALPVDTAVFSLSSNKANSISDLQVSITNRLADKTSTIELGWPVTITETGVSTLTLNVDGVSATADINVLSGFPSAASASSILSCGSKEACVAGSDLIVSLSVTDSLDRDLALIPAARAKLLLNQDTTLLDDVPFVLVEGNLTAQIPLTVSSQQGTISLETSIFNPSTQRWVFAPVASVTSIMVNSSTCDSSQVDLSSLQTESISGNEAEFSVCGSDAFGNPCTLTEPPANVVLESLEDIMVSIQATAAQNGNCIIMTAIPLKAHLYEWKSNDVAIEGLPLVNVLPGSVSSLSEIINPSSTVPFFADTANQIVVNAKDANGNSLRYNTEEIGAYFDGGCAKVTNGHDGTFVLNIHAKSEGTNTARVTTVVNGHTSVIADVGVSTVARTFSGLRPITPEAWDCGVYLATDTGDNVITMNEERQVGGGGSLRRCFIFLY